MIPEGHTIEDIKTRERTTAQSYLIKEEGAKLRQGFQINWNMVRLKYISG